MFLILVEQYNKFKSGFSLVFCFFVIIRGLFKSVYFVFGVFWSFSRGSRICGVISFWRAEDQLVVAFELLLLRCFLRVRVVFFCESVVLSLLVCFLRY